MYYPSLRHERPCIVLGDALFRRWEINPSFYILLQRQTMARGGRKRSDTFNTQLIALISKDILLVGIVVFN